MALECSLAMLVNGLEFKMTWNTVQKANEHCCEEAALHSHTTYIPCNKHAVNIVGWKGRSDAPIRMCEFCTDHNVRNRGGEIIKPYLSPAMDAAATSWPSNPVPSNPYDAMSEDQLLMKHIELKQAIETAKEQEMELRKYIVSRAFPDKHEGMNTKELGAGYQLKAAVKYNYNLADNDTVEKCLEKIASLGNQGPFIADRLVSWKPSFLLTEYRQLQEDAEKGEGFAKACLDAITPMLTITEAAPTLEVKEPKAKKK